MLLSGRSNKLSRDSFLESVSGPFLRPTNGSLV